MNYALIIDGVVENVFVCDTNEIARTIYPGNIVVNIDDTGAGIGWSYDGNSFIAPPEPEKTPEEIAAENLATAQSEYERATINITQLNEQIADDDYAGTTEDSVKAELSAWTEYRKELRSYLKDGDGSHILPNSPASTIS